MTLTRVDYNLLCQTIGIPQNQRNFTNGYSYCDSLYQVYFQNVINRLNKPDYETVILMFLESCPLNTTNYIFGATTNQISYNNDSYLWNIYTGFIGSNPLNNYTKGNCLNGLLNYTTKNKISIPLIVLDLFPFHGIALKGYRKAICKNIGNPLILNDALYYINQIPNYINKLFLFGLPYTIWNYIGGYGLGSLYINSLSAQAGLLGSFVNNSIMINVGGQNISSKSIIDWRINEKID